VVNVQRLKGRRPFSQTFQSGRTYSNRLVVVFVQDVPGEPTRVGFAVARAAGRPVKRNRIRRRLRAVIALLDERIRPGRRVVILGKASVLDADFRELCRGVEGLLRRAGCMEES
jgi:ribonuclease P protein component